MITVKNVNYSFDRRISLYDDVDYILDIYKASMITFTRVHGLKPHLYADSKTLKYLKGYYDIGINIDKQNFTYVDDLKVWIHTQHDLSCITMDGDILFSERLQFPNEYNTQVYFEVEETNSGALNPKNNIYNGYTSLRKIFKKYKIRETLPDYKYNNDSACNVGIIKFSCQETKDKLIQSYYNIRNFYHDNIRGDEEMEEWFIPSIMLTQYYWGSVCKVNNIQTTFLKKFNSYIHLYGAWKYNYGIPEKIREIIKSETQSKLL